MRGEASTWARCRVLVLLVLATASLSLPPAPVLAQVRLTWRAPPACPSEEQAGFQLAELLHTSLDAIASDLAASVEITEAFPNTFQARITTRTSSQERHLAMQDADCLALTHAAALLLALAIDPEAELEPEPKQVARPLRPAPERTSTVGRAGRVRRAPALAAMSGAVSSGSAPPSDAVVASQSAVPGSPLKQAPQFEPTRGEPTRGEPDNGRSPADAELPRPRQTNGQGVDLPAQTAADADSAAALERSERAETTRPTSSPRDASAQPAVETRERVVLPYEPLTIRDSAGRPTVPSQTDASTDVDLPMQTSNEASSLRAYFAAGVGLTAGVVPNVAPFGDVSVGLMTQHVRAALRVGYAPPQSTVESGEVAGGIGGNVWLARAAAEAGPRLYAAALEFPIMAGVEAGVFRADGQGVAQHQAQSAYWLAMYLGAGLAARLSARLSILSRIEGLVALRRPRFALRDGALEPRVFHQPDRLSARVSLALQWQFQ